MKGLRILTMYLLGVSMVDKKVDKVRRNRSKKNKTTIVIHVTDE